MRILQLSSARHFGGGERHFVDLANALADRGHDVFVALPSDSPLKKELSKIPQGHFLTISISNSLDIADSFRVRQFVRQQRFDIVHAHVARDYPFAALAVGGTAARLVLTRHVLFPLNKIHRLTQRRVAHVIAVSAAVATVLNDQHIFDERKIVVVRNGVDLNRFGQTQHHARDGLRRVGMIGELSAIKGQEDFIRAAVLIVQQHDDVEFIIAGEDQSAEGRNRRQLVELIPRYGLNGRVKLVGWLDDVPKFLSSLDVFVSASHSESFGLAIVEAMAAGVPVDATATEGAREVIGAQQNGQLIAIGDSSELARAINDVLSSAELRASLSAAGTKRATEAFSLDRMVSETEQVYLDVLA